MRGASRDTGILLFVAAIAGGLGFLVADSESERASLPSVAQSSAVGYAQAPVLATEVEPSGESRETVQPSTRAIAVAPEEVIDDPSATVDAEDLREAMNAGLLAEVTALLRSGRIAEQSVHEDESLRSFLVEAYLDMDEAQSAAAVLERFPSADDDLYAAVGRALARDGDSVRASQMFLAALERDPSGWVEIEWLMTLDPAGALAVLDAKLAGFRTGATPDHVHTRARLLAAAGRLEEARAQLGEAPTLGPEANYDYFEVLSEVDPDAFERVARMGMSRSKEDTSVPDHFAEYFAFNLACLYAQTDRGPEAVILLENLLAQDPADYSAIDVLFAVDHSRAFAYLEALPPEPWVPWLSDDAGDYLLEEGRIHDAIDAWMIAVRGDVFSESAFEQLKRHAPERLWAHLDRCRELAVERNNDFVLGAIADLYWGSDRRGEAVELWQQASRIAPGDKEWTDKLRRAAAGGDPTR